MRRPIVSATLVSLALAIAIHLDWHFARPAHHQLSLGLSWHWVIAIPVFALVAWYVARVWPAHARSASLGIVGSAVLLAGVIEPAWEYFIGDAPSDWAFGTMRNVALGAYLLAGLISYVAALAFLGRRADSVAS